MNVRVKPGVKGAPPARRASLIRLWMEVCFLAADGPDVNFLSVL